jgi:hypothetical protein
MAKKYDEFLVNHQNAQDKELQKERLKTLILETLEMFSSQGEDSAYIMTDNQSLVDYAILFLKKEVLVPEDKIKIVYDVNSLKVLGIEVYFKETSQ